MSKSQIDPETGFGKLTENLWMQATAAGDVTGEPVIRLMSRSPDDPSERQVVCIYLEDLPKLFATLAEAAMVLTMKLFDKQTDCWYSKN